MTQVTFYSLSEKDKTGQTLSCSLCASLYANKQKVSVWCADKTEAEAFDEMLWQLPADRFIPHNLSGEGPKNGAPVEICWQAEQLRRGVTLIVLSQITLEQPQSFRQIIDFVPADDAQKAAARDRYKYYQRAGCNMHFTQPDC